MQRHPHAHAPISIAARRARRGLTLLELVIVILILAALAALIVPQFGSVSKNARLSSSVSNLNDMSRTMELFTTASNGKFPDGFDSLLNADDDSVVYPGNGDPKENSGVWGGWLTVDVLSAGEYQSWLRTATTPTTTPPFYVSCSVYDHDVTATDANQSTANSTPRLLTNSGSNVAFVDPTTSGGANVYKAFNLDTTDTSFRIMALGVGPRCSLVGRNSYKIGMKEAPVAGDPAPNAEFAYSRVIALFRVSADSLYFAEYIGSVTSYGKPADSVRAFIE